MSMKLVYVYPPLAKMTEPDGKSVNTPFIAELFGLASSSATRDIPCFFLHQARPAPTSFGGVCLCEEAKTASFSCLVGALEGRLAATNRRIRHLPFRSMLP